MITYVLTDGEAESVEKLQGKGEKRMALTQKMLKAMGIEDDQREQILDAHQEVLESIKSERDQYKAEAAKVPDLQRQLEEAKSESTDESEWEKKYNEEHQAFEDFRAQIEIERADAEKAKAYRGMLMAAGVDPKRIDAIMRVTDLSEVEMENGALKESGKLEEAAKKEWADFIIKTTTRGSDPANPPKRQAEVDGADPEIARRMQERYERKYGKAPEN